MTFIQVALLALGLAQDGSTRTAEPDAALQKEALRKIKELFKTEYARKLPAEQLDLARQLLQSGLETADDPAAKWVLFREARDLAVAVGDPEIAVKAMGEAARAFAVDGPGLKLAALGKLSIRDPEAARGAARACLAVVAEAVGAEAFETAAAAAARGETFAKAAQDVSLAARAADTKAEVASLKSEAARVKPLIEKPGMGDAEAVGRYLCFVKGDWDAGLIHLVAGGKGAVKAAADKELLKPAEAAARADAADAWWDVAQKEKSAWRRERILARTKHWLELAAPDASGLLKVRIQRRLDDVEALQPGFVNLLRMVEPSKDGLAGTWKLEDGKLVSGAGKFTRLEFPYQPPEEYDFRVVFKPLSGFNVSQILSRKGKGFLWIWEFGLNRAALGNCRGQWITDAANPSRVDLEPLPGGGAVTSLIEVRKDRVRTFLNGKLVREYKTDYADLSMNGEWKLRSEQLLGLGCWESPTEFLKADLTEVSGKGKRLR